ncbi:acyl-protein thioesterase 1 [Scenedesmus sp. PABB004]|nr:acyl-protein thioesterase 1 [Scenedesmus sp. PABB004]
MAQGSCSGGSRARLLVPPCLAAAALLLAVSLVMPPALSRITTRLPSASNATAAVASRIAAPTAAARPRAAAPPPTTGAPRGPAAPRAFASGAGGMASQALKYREPIVFNARDKHTGTVIMLHGLGDSGDGWAPVGAEWAPDLRHVKFIFPHAPNRPVSVNFGMMMPSWYDIVSLEDIDQREDKAGLLESKRYVESLVEAEVAGGVPSERVVVAGFSQGGAVALMALRSEHKLAGVVGLSTYLPLRKEPPLVSAANARTPIFQAHGDADYTVAYKFGVNTHNMLKEAGADVTFKTYNGMAHGACPQEIADVGAFLKRVLPPVLDVAYHSVTAMVGAGVLGLPAVVSHLGWAGGAIMLLFSFWVRHVERARRARRRAHTAQAAASRPARPRRSWYTYRQLVYMHEVPDLTCREGAGVRRLDRYDELAAYVLGERRGRALLMPFQLAVLVGLAITYTVVGGDSLHAFAVSVAPNGAAAAIGKWPYYVMFGGLQLLLSLLPSFNELSLVSLLGALVSLGYCTIAVAMSATVNPPRGSVNYDPAAVPRSDLSRVMGIFNAITSVLFAYGGHNVALEIQARAAPGGSRQTRVNVTFVLTGLAYFSVSLVGFWVYTQPVFQLIERRIALKSGARVNPLLGNAIRLTYVAAITAVGIVVPFFSSLMGLVGAIAVTPTTFLLPPLFWLLYKRPRRFGLEWAVNVFLVGVTALIGVLGTIGSVYSIIEAWGTFKRRPQRRAGAAAAADDRAAAALSQAAALRQQHPTLAAAAAAAAAAAVQVGVLAAIKPWCSAPASFIWSALADRTGRHRSILLATFVASTLVRVAVVAVRGGGSAFAAFLALAVVGEVLAAPVGVIADAAVVSACAKDTDYGKQRLWGAVGWGVLSAFAGELVSRYGLASGFAAFALLSVPAVGCAARMDYSRLGGGAAQPAAAAPAAPAGRQRGAEPQPPHGEARCEQQALLAPAPDMPTGSLGDGADATVLLVCDGSRHGTPAQQPEPAQQQPLQPLQPQPVQPGGADAAPGCTGAGAAPPPFWSRVGALLSRRAVLVLLAMATVMGFGIGVIGEFLFLHLADLGGGAALMGLTLTVTCMAEVPVFHLSGALLARVRPQVVLHAVVATYALRLGLYALLSSRHVLLVLLIEPLHGITFGAGWGAGTVLAKRVAPPGLEATCLSLFQSSYFGVGSGLGALVGGLLKRRLGGRAMFAASAALVTAGWAVCGAAELACRTCAAGREAPAAERLAKYAELASKDSGPDLAALRDDTAPLRDGRARRPSAG